MPLNADKTNIKSVSSDLFQQAITITNEHILEQEGVVAYEQTLRAITKEKYVELTPELIKEQMSSKERQVLEETLDAVIANNDTKSLRKIKSEIISDYSLSNQEKQILFDMIDIIESSYTFWTNKLESPTGSLTRSIRIDYERVVAADCIWFWQGAVWSGLSPLVAIGFSALGSLSAHLNSL